MLRRIVSAAFHTSRYLSSPREVSSPLILGARSACSSPEGPQTQSSLDFSSGGYKNIEVMNVDRVRVIGLDRPRQRNAVNRQTARELYDAFCTFDEDQSADVAVLYGKGGNFCAGYDLKELSSVNPTTGELDEYLKECAPDKAFGPMGPSRLLLSKPVIAAVTGYAVAGGLELALICDMRVAEENATFGVFCRRFGVPLTDGGTVRLPALIGLSRALDMILTGRPVSAQEAHSIGLANRVVSRGNALNEALVLANQIAAFPQECMRADRHSAYHSVYHAHSQLTENWFKDALSYEYSEGVKVLQKESIPGARRFAQGTGRQGQF